VKKQAGIFSVSCLLVVICAYERISAAVFDFLHSFSVSFFASAFT